MNEIKVKEIMIPISKCLKVRKDQSLIEVFKALDQIRATENDAAHKDAIVLDESGDFNGKVTMIDIFRALEPRYGQVKQQQKMASMLSAGAVMKVAKDFDLWMEPTKTIRERANQLKVADVMHAPEKIEYIKEGDSLEKALHIYVMGVHQPLIVRNDNDDITGVLRFGDIFEAFRRSLLSCDPALD
jgi:CBS domain containing-hemolysin-like protein